MTAQQPNPQSIAFAQSLAETSVIDVACPAGRRPALDNGQSAFMPQRHFQRPLRPARKSLRQIRTVISQNALSCNFTRGAWRGQLGQPLRADRRRQSAAYQFDNRRARIGPAIVTTRNARKAGADNNARHGMLAL